jgi:hypothetical protein
MITVPIDSDGPFAKTTEVGDTVVWTDEADNLLGVYTVSGFAGNYIMLEVTSNEREI